MWYLFILFGLPVYGRLEDNVAVQQSEVCEDRIPRNVDQSYKDRTGKVIIF